MGGSLYNKISLGRRHGLLGLNTWILAACFAAAAGIGLILLLV